MSEPIQITFDRDLTASLYSHDLTVSGATVPCWTLVTDGLVKVRQPELVLTIVRRREASKEFPPSVLGYIPAVKQFAQQGRVVNAGDVSGYRAPGPFGLAEFVGLTFLETTPIKGVKLQNNAVCGVFLTEGELAMAMSCAVSRVVYRLGKQARHFPAPYWSDPERHSVYAPSDTARSLLSQIDRRRSHRATAILRGDSMVLTLPLDAAEYLATQLEHRNSAAIIPGRDASVTAALVWTPGQTESEAIFAEGTDPSSFAATFVGLVPNDAPRDNIRFIEDGYFALLSARSTSQVAAALRAQSTIELVDGARTLTLTPTVGCREAS